MFSVDRFGPETEKLPDQVDSLQPLVLLLVRSTNEAVRGFYEHLGYEDANVQVRSQRLT